MEAPTPVVGPEGDWKRSFTPEINEHSPTSLLPLLHSHLPASILVYGSILSPSSSTSPDSIRIWSNIQARDDDSSITVAAEGTIIVQLSSISGGQLRIFDTLDSIAEADLSEDAIGRGKKRVVSILRDFMKVDKAPTWKVGGLHERWVMPVVNELGDGVDPEREHVWLPPKDVDSFMASDGAVEGYEVDIGREVDIQAVSLLYLPIS
jgi:hypothetical protein